MNVKQYVVIAGPTGSGKSALALHLAAALGGEILNCDSVQVYRGFELGAAKATAAERAQLPHHLLDLAAWDEDFDAATYAAAAHQVKAEVLALGRLPLVVGGTGLYLRALLGQGWHADLPQDSVLRAELAGLPSVELQTRLQALDPERAAELHPNDRVRLLRSLELTLLLGKPLRDAGLVGDKKRDGAAYVVVLEPPRPVLHERIAARTAAMLAGGLVAEVEALLAVGVAPTCKPMQSIGYKQVCDYLAGRLEAAALPAAIVAATRQYAKRQCTWFRSVDADLRLNGGESTGEVVELIRAALF